MHEGHDPPPQSMKKWPRFWSALSGMDPSAPEWKILVNQKDFGGYFDYTIHLRCWAAGVISRPWADTQFAAVQISELKAQTLLCHPESFLNHLRTQFSSKLKLNPSSYDKKAYRLLPGYFHEKNSFHKRDPTGNDWLSLEGKKSSTSP